MTLKLLGLALPGARIHILRREQGTQGSFAFTANGRIARIMRQIVGFFRIAAQIEQLRWVFDIVDVFELPHANCECAGCRSHAVILA